MPKISAPTVVEHRARQRAALLDAAKDIALDEGHQAVTFAAVAARSGLARNSVYEYFDSPQDLLGSLVLEHMRDWTAIVSAAINAETTPEDKICAYVRTGLRHMTAEQPLARSLAEMPLPAHYRSPMVELVAGMVGPLSTAVADRGVAEPEATATYLQGAMRAAARRVDAGFAHIDDEVRSVQRFALASTAPCTAAVEPA